MPICILLHLFDALSKCNVLYVIFSMFKYNNNKNKTKEMSLIKKLLYLNLSSAKVINK